MAQHNETGKYGESVAVDFLKQNGYTILEQNWRYSRNEIDIIAKDPDDTIVFVEVKARSTAYFGYPEEAVSAKKQQLLLEAANEYLVEQGLENELRFDIIAIIFAGKEVQDIRHFRDAIVPY